MRPNKQTYISKAIEFAKNAIHPDGVVTVTMEEIARWKGVSVDKIRIAK